jgi:hypothetical protein
MEIPPTYGKPAFNVYHIPDDEMLDPPRICTQEYEIE